VDVAHLYLLIIAHNSLHFNPKTKVFLPAKSKMGIDFFGGGGIMKVALI
jgi:hypothetical protein